MTNRTKEQLKKHYRDYQGKPEQIKKRASRNKARRQAEKEGRVHKNDGKDLDHKNSNPLDNRKENLQVVSKKKNRGKRSKSGKTI